MKNLKRILLLLLVLTPSFFFLSKAFSSNRVILNDQTLEVSGPGGLDIPLSDIHELQWLEDLPELSGTPGFSLGLIKKGNFIRASDGMEIRVIKNGERGFIHLQTERGEVYLNLPSIEDTRSLYSDLLAASP